MSQHVLNVFSGDCTRCGAWRHAIQDGMAPTCAGFRRTHVLDDMTGNCIACGATREWMHDYYARPCLPDGRGHPRSDGPLRYDDPAPGLKNSPEFIEAMRKVQWTDQGDLTSWDGPEARVIFNGPGPAAMTAALERSCADLREPGPATHRSTRAFERMPATHPPSGTQWCAAYKAWIGAVTEQDLTPSWDRPQEPA